MFTLFMIAAVYGLDTANVTLPISLVRDESDTSLNFVKQDILPELQSKYFRFKLESSEIIIDNASPFMVIGEDTLKQIDITKSSIDKLIYKNIVKKERQKIKPELGKKLSYTQAKRRMMTIIMFIIIVSPTLIFHYLRIRKYDKKHKKR